MSFMSNFGIFYDARSPNMAMSRDPRSKFRKNVTFFLILHLTLGKATKFLVKNLSPSEVISRKPHGGVENTPQVLLGLIAEDGHLCCQVPNANLMMLCFPDDFQSQLRKLRDCVKW